MSSPLFHVTIQPSTLPGQYLYPKLATAKLEDPVLQPVVERKGCEKILGEMRDCLVETHCWGKCEEEVQRFQECINTRYFEEAKEPVEIDAEIATIQEEKLEINAYEEIKSSDTADSNDSSLINEDEELGTKHEDDPLAEESKAGDSAIETTNLDEENEPSKHEDGPPTEESNVEDSATERTNLDQENEPEEVEIIEELNENTQKPDVETEGEVSEEANVQTDSNTKEVAKEESIVDKDSFRVKIVSKSVEEVANDENLLFNVSVKDTET